MEALSLLVSLYPHLCFHICTDVSSHTLTFDSPPRPLEPKIAKKIDHFRNTMSKIKGNCKPGTHWRSSINNTIEYCLCSLDALRSTFQDAG